MKKRIRRKKRVGDFQVFVFKVGFRFSDKLSTITRNCLIDRFIQEAIEDNGLQFGGGGRSFEWNGYIEMDNPSGIASNDQRDAVKKWLVQESQIFEYYVGDWFNHYDHSERQWLGKKQTE